MTCPEHPAMTPRQIWYGAWAGLAALLLGLGIGRFGYPPLIPLLVQQHWFSAPEAAYLASINLVGYVAGALLASARGSRWPTGRMARLSMGTVIFSYLLCLRPAAFLWFAAWRLLAGIAGGFLMVLAVSTVLARTPAAQRGKVGGLVFVGVGSGIVLAGATVPLLARISLPAAWFGLGFAALLLTLTAWPYWKESAAAAAPARVHNSGLRVTRPLALLMAMYGAAAIGLAPYSLFWVDFIARGLHAGIAAGGRYWSLFGLSAALGPLAVGLIAGRAGFRLSLRWCLFIESAGAFLPLFSTLPVALAVTSISVGAMGMGVTALASGRTLEITAAAHQKQVWGWMTATFSISYAGAAALLSFVFARTGSHRLLFAIGAAALLGGGLIDLLPSTAAVENPIPEVSRVA